MSRGIWQLFQCGFAGCCGWRADLVKGLFHIFGIGGGHRIFALEPFAQIQIGAALGTERAIGRIGGFAADRTAHVSTRLRADGRVCAAVRNGPAASSRPAPFHRIGAERCAKRSFELAAVLLVHRRQIQRDLPAHPAQAQAVGEALWRRPDWPSAPLPERYRRTGVHIHSRQGAGGLDIHRRPRRAGAPHRTRQSINLVKNAKIGLKRGPPRSRPLPVRSSPARPACGHRHRSAFGRCPPVSAVAGDRLGEDHASR